MQDEQTPGRNDPAAGPVDGVRIPSPWSVPPVQIRPEELNRMTPEQIDAAFERQELHLILGGGVDAEGWPTDGKGRRLNPPGPRGV